MKNYILIGAILAHLINADQQVAFVYELVRHGARAPLKNVDPNKFKVTTGMLTASGMRHRMLLGKFNR